MPAIRGQAVLSNGFEISTTEYGKRRVEFLELGGNDVRLTFFLDDTQVSQQTLNNPSLTTLYTTVGAGLFPGAALSADGKTMIVDAKLHISWHLIQRTPLELKLMTSYDMPPANWWQ
jgi:hypothetical protein